MRTNRERDIVEHLHSVLMATPPEGHYERATFDLLVTRETFPIPTDVLNFVAVVPPREPSDTWRLARAAHDSPELVADLQAFHVQVVQEFGADAPLCFGFIDDIDDFSLFVFVIRGEDYDDAQGEDFDRQNRLITWLVKQKLRPGINISIEHV